MHVEQLMEILQCRIFIADQTVHSKVEVFTVVVGTFAVVVGTFTVVVGTLTVVVGTLQHINKLPKVTVYSLVRCTYSTLNNFS